MKYWAKIKCRMWENLVLVMYCCVILGHSFLNINDLLEMLGCMNTQNCKNIHPSLHQGSSSKHFDADGLNSISIVNLNTSNVTGNMTSGSNQYSRKLGPNSKNLSYLVEPPTAGSNLYHHFKVKDSGRIWIGVLSPFSSVQQPHKLFKNSARSFTKMIYKKVYYLLIFLTWTLFAAAPCRKISRLGNKENTPRKRKFKGLSFQINAV